MVPAEDKAGVKCCRELVRRRCDPGRAERKCGAITKENYSNFALTGKPRANDEGEGVKQGRHREEGCGQNFWDLHLTFDADCLSQPSHTGMFPGQVAQQSFFDRVLESGRNNNSQHNSWENRPDSVLVKVLVLLVT